MALKTLNQNNLYHAYVNQLYNHGSIKIQIETKEWEGDLKEYVTGSYKHLKNVADFKSVARYLLKMMDIELPTRNPITQHNMNKNHFNKVNKEDLTHHISWLREQLIYNNIRPYNDSV